LIAATGWALIGSRMRAAGLRADVKRRIDQAVGAVFLGLAGLLAGTRR
jgi:threonine/homoserine/homoserine lactone efflux protein